MPLSLAALNDFEDELLAMGYVVEEMVHNVMDIVGVKILKDSRRTAHVIAGWAVEGSPKGAAETISRSHLAGQTDWDIYLKMMPPVEGGEDGHGD